MSIPKFVTFTSGAVPVEVENIDTDQIIPARFLKATERKGTTAKPVKGNTPSWSRLIRKAKWCGN